MALFSLLGSTMGFSVETFGFYALFLPLMAALGYDRMVTAAMIILGALVGVMASTVNPFSIGVAAGEAGVSIGEGIVLRLVLWVVLVGIAIAYVLRYAAKVRRDPAASLVGLDRSADDDSSEAPTTDDRRRGRTRSSGPMTGTQKCGPHRSPGRPFGLMIFSVIPWSSIFGGDAGPGRLLRRPT